MKTIEELFVTEYEKQKQTIDDLKKEIDSLNERIKDLNEGIKANQEHHQATLDEINRIGLTYHRAGYINTYFAMYGKELEDEFPILSEAGCIEFPEENEDGIK